MQSTAKPMIGVRVPAEQVVTIRRLAGSERSASEVIRQALSEGLARLEKERST